MIVCENCGTPQFLQITSSTAFYKDGEEIQEITEEYECTLCKNTGKYEWDDENGPTVSGAVTLKDEQPNWPTTSS